MADWVCRPEPRRTPGRLTHAGVPTPSPCMRSASTSAEINFTTLRDSRRDSRRFIRLVDLYTGEYWAVAGGVSLSATAATDSHDAAAAAAPNQHRVALVSELLRAGASLDIRINISEDQPIAGLSGRFDSVDDLVRAIERSAVQLRDNEHWAMIRSLVEGVRAAGGTWAAYARLPRRRVLRLRTLVARGRARTVDPIIDPVFRLPNEMCWHVLKFWPATCATTGEVL